MSDSIDSFLKQICQEKGVILEEMSPPPVKIKLVIARKPDGQYITCCYLPENGIIEKNLEGNILSHSTIRATSLPEFANDYNELLEDMGLAYHRDPPEFIQLTDDDKMVTFSVVNRLSDPDGKDTLNDLSQMHAYAVRYSQRLFGPKSQ